MTEPQDSWLRRQWRRVNPMVAIFGGLLLFGAIGAGVFVALPILLGAIFR